MWAEPLNPSVHSWPLCKTVGHWAVVGRALWTPLNPSVCSLWLWITLGHRHLGVGPGWALFHILAGEGDHGVPGTWKGILPSPSVGSWCLWRTVCNWSGFRGACGAVCRLITAVEDQAVLGGRSLREGAPWAPLRASGRCGGTYHPGTLRGVCRAPIWPAGYWRVACGTCYLGHPTGPICGFLAAVEACLALGGTLPGGTLPSPSVNSCFSERKFGIYFTTEIPRTEEPGGLQSMGLQSQTQLSSWARTGARARAHTHTHTLHQKVLPL